jgi:hypothetical protein
MVNELSWAAMRRSMCGGWSAIGNCGSAPRLSGNGSLRYRCSMPLSRESSASGSKERSLLTSFAGSPGIVLATVAFSQNGSSAQTAASELRGLFMSAARAEHPLTNRAAVSVFHSAA